MSTMLQPHWFLITALLTVALAAPAQVRLTRHSKPSLRVDVSLVLVPVTVTDRRGASVTGLQRDQFQIFEDKAPQQIVSFSSEDVPSSVGLVLDVSGSMKGKLARAYGSTQKLFQVAHPDDEVFLVTFAQRPEMEAEFSSDFEALQKKLQLVKPEGWTSLIDAVYLALDRMRAARTARKALVIVSDGMDNHSRYSRSELMARAVEADVQIYTIAIHDPPRTKKPLEVAEQRQGLFLLQDLANLTGGLHFVIRSIDEISAAAEKIRRALHQQYVSGYRASESRNHSWRKIQVKLEVPHLRIYARRGYFPPGP